MNDSRDVVQVLDRTEKLLEVISRELFIEATTSILNLDVAKKITLLNKFQHYEIYLYRISIILDDDLSIDIVLDKFNDVWVIHLLQKCNFVQQNLFEYL